MLSSIVGVFLFAQQIVAQVNNEAWELLKENNQSAVIPGINDANNFKIKFSSENNRYELSYGNKYLGYGERGIGCHLQQDGVYNCIAFNNLNCFRASYDASGNKIADWKKDLSCGLNNIKTAIDLFNALDIKLRAGSLFDYHAVPAEHIWNCAPEQEPWSLQSLYENKFLLNANTEVHYVPFLYDIESRRDGSYCLEKIADYQYKIQARGSDIYIDRGYLNKEATLFDSKKEDAGVFVIAFTDVQNNNPLDTQLVNIKNNTDTTVDNQAQISDKNLENKIEQNKIEQPKQAKQYLESVFQIILILIFSIFFLFIGTRQEPGVGNNSKGLGGGGGSSGNW